jgi:hypothetical protein
MISPLPPWKTELLALSSTTSRSVMLLLGAFAKTSLDFLVLCSTQRKITAVHCPCLLQGSGEKSP